MGKDRYSANLEAQLPDWRLRERDALEGGDGPAAPGRRPLPAQAPSADRHFRWTIRSHAGDQR